MKVKFFCSQELDVIENQVNDFLETVSNVIDIKFSTCDFYYDVMIIYNETKESK